MTSETCNTIILLSMIVLQNSQSECVNYCRRMIPFASNFHFLVILSEKMDFRFLSLSCGHEWSRKRQPGFSCDSLICHSCESANWQRESRHVARAATVSSRYSQRISPIRSTCSSVLCYGVWIPAFAGMTNEVCI